MNTFTLGTMGSDVYKEYPCAGRIDQDDISLIILGTTPEQNDVFAEVMNTLRKADSEAYMLLHARKAEMLYSVEEHVHKALGEDYDMNFNLFATAPDTASFMGTSITEITPTTSRQDMVNMYLRRTFSAMAVINSSAFTRIPSGLVEDVLSGYTALLKPNRELRASNVVDFKSTKRL